MLFCIIQDNVYFYRIEIYMYIYIYSELCEILRMRFVRRDSVVIC